MAERFPNRSILSVVSSQESGEKPAKSSKGRPRRSQGRPPQKDAGSRGKSNPSAAPELENRRLRAKSNPPSKIEYLQSLSASAMNGNQPRPTNPAPRSRKQTNPPTSLPGEGRKRQKEEPPLPPVGTKPVAPRTRSVSEPPPPQPRSRAAKRPRRRSTSPLVYATRLLIVGIGIAVISGTALSVLNALSHSAAGAAQEQNSQTAEAQKSQQTNPTPTPAARLALPLTQEMAGLKQQIQALATQNPNLTAGVFLADLDTGGFVSLNSEVALPAASTIKVPILVAFFQAVDEGRVRLDQKLTLRKEHLGGGSGEIQFQKLGREYTALEVATKMIVISDNTATNMMIELLGGMEALNQQFLTLGLKGTALHNNLPDLEGTNTTSPRDLVNLMAQIHQGGVVSMKSRDRILHIMQQTENDSLLPRGLDREAIIAHKTGTIDSMLADVGLVDMPSGKRYLIAVMVKHAKTEGGADKLIRDISKVTYQYLSEGETAASPAPKL